MSRAKARGRCPARSRANVAVADAVSGKRLRSGCAESRSVGSDARANASRDGRGFGGVGGGPATGSYIGGPSLERLLDTRSDLIRGKTTASSSTHVDRDLSNC